jgi:hypothetical protein
MFLSGAALGGAMLWGTVEFLALQWSWFSERFRMQGMFPTR